MGLGIKTGRWALAGVILAMMPITAHGENTKDAPKASPVGIDTNWDADVRTTPDVAGNTITDEHQAVIKNINAYFNEINDLRGAFVQTAADDRKARGKFFVKRPGRFRFVYSPPSKLIILSDGDNLLIEDHDLKTVDRFPLDSTPFRLLLKKDVDILRDAHVTKVDEKEDGISITISDKKSDSSGRIQLYFLKKPELELREWIITDAQGLDTRIAIAELDTKEEIDKKLFVGSKIDMPDFSGNE